MLQNTDCVCASGVERFRCTDIRGQMLHRVQQIRRTIGFLAKVGALCWPKCVSKPRFGFMVDEHVYSCHKLRNIVLACTSGVETYGLKYRNTFRCRIAKNRLSPSCELIMRKILAYKLDHKNWTPVANNAFWDHSLGMYMPKSFFRMSANANALSWAKCNSLPYKRLQRVANVYKVE